MSIGPLSAEGCDECVHGVNSRVNRGVEEVYRATTRNDYGLKESIN